MNIHKALTFRASSIGDCLMGKYLLENIHVQFPEAHLGIVVASRTSMIRDLFAAYPWLEVIEANRRDPRALWSLWKDFHGSDLVVTQYAGKRGGRFGFASKLAARLLARRGGLIGFHDASRLNGILYDQLLPVRSDIAVAEHDRAALRAANVSVSLPFPTLQYKEDDTVLPRLGFDAGNYVVVHLFAGNKSRGLHPNKKRELLAALAKELPHTRLLLSGGAADREEALLVAEGSEAIVIAGEVTLQELMNIIAKSRGVVSVDTGVAHITAQLRKPLTVLRTCLGTTWWFSGQYGSDARITVFSREDICAAGHLYKDYPDCLNPIDMGAVAQKVFSS